MTHEAPTPDSNERTVTTEYLGVISGKIGKQSVFLARHFEDGEEVYSMASLLPIGPSFTELAQQEIDDAFQQQESDEH